MKQNIKKIIAREGLIILGCIILGFIIIWCGSLSIPNPFEPKGTRIKYSDYTVIKFEKKPSTEVIKEAYNQINDGTWDPSGPDDKSLPSDFIAWEILPPKPISLDSVTLIGYLILIFGYPLYLVIRFVLWAIKTLK